MCQSWWLLYKYRIVEMGHHYKNLLVNMPVRHTISTMDTNNERLTHQFQRYMNMDIMNFFILAR